MTDTSGISVCFGNVQDEVLLENAKLALREMKAKWSDKIQIDTTHFVCTTPAATPSGAQATGGTGSAPGVEYQRALQLSIPIVQPHWILACHSEKKYAPIDFSHYHWFSSNTQNGGNLVILPRRHTKHTTYSNRRKTTIHVPSLPYPFWVRNRFQPPTKLPLKVTSSCLHARPAPRSRYSTQHRLPIPQPNPCQRRSSRTAFCAYAGGDSRR